MDSSPLANMLPNFLEPLVGKPGKAVLDNLVKGEEQLRAFVLPRIIVGWLRTVGDGNVSLPNGSPFSSLRKSAGGFSGEITIGSCLHSFENSLDTSVAAMVSLSSCSSAVEVTAKASDLAKIAKTIDLLCKSVSMNPKAPVIEVKAVVHPVVELPVVAMPIMPPKGKVTIPSVKKSSRKTIKLAKSQVDARCEVCAGALFSKMEFVGCDCLGDLAKSVKTRSLGGCLELSFSEDIDEDAWLCLAEVLL